MVALGNTYLEAARASGAGALRTNLNIVLPLLRPTIGGAGALMFVLLTHEFAASLLVRAPTTQVMGTVLFDYYTNGSYPLVAADRADHDRDHGHRRHSSPSSSAAPTPSTSCRSPPWRSSPTATSAPSSGSAPPTSPATPGARELTLATQASLAALADAGLTAADVDGIVRCDMDNVRGNDLAHSLGIRDLTYWARTGPAGRRRARWSARPSAAILSGQATTVLVFRSLNGRSGRRFGPVAGRRAPASAAAAPTTSCSPPTGCSRPGRSSP